MVRLTSSLVVLLASVGFAQEWQVSASVRHSVDGPVDPVFARPVLVQAVEVRCEAPGRTPRWSSPGIRTVFASSPSEEFTVAGGLGVVTASDRFSVRLDTAQVVLGAKVQPELTVVCGGGLSGGSEPVRVLGAPVAAAPLIQAGSLFATREGSLTESFQHAIPVGVPVRLRAVLYAQPRGTERVIVHAEGPGVSVRREYTAASSPGPRESAVMRAFLEDPAFVVAPTGEGTLELWAEFEGLRSEVRTLRVEGRAEEPEPSPGAEEVARGCSTAALPPAGLALLVLLRRRRWTRRTP